MDEMRPPAEAVGLPVQGPHWRTDPAEPPSTGFVPLRLLLQPSGPVLELTEPDMVVGRHSDADIRLPLPDVSRWHCRFLCVEGCWQVIDLNSLNGVYVNDEAVQQAPLQQGDRVRIGGFTFAVDLSGDPPPAIEVEAQPGVLRTIFKAMPRRVRGPHRRAS